MFLSTTIHSIINPKIKYGHAGDEVKEIADHGTVLIVEGPGGTKFPVSLDKLTNEFIKVAPGTAAKQLATSVAKDDQPFPNQMASVPKKGTPLNQASLF